MFEAVAEPELDRAAYAQGDRGTEHRHARVTSGGGGGAVVGIVVHHHDVGGRKQGAYILDHAGQILPPRSGRE